jgi:hypothetical protein
MPQLPASFNRQRPRGPSAITAPPFRHRAASGLVIVRCGFARDDGWLAGKGGGASLETLRIEKRPPNRGGPLLLPLKLLFVF